MEGSLLREVVTVLGLAIVIVLVCRRVRVPPIVGFLLTGVVAGPHGLSLVGSEKEVHFLAEVGVVLLLFTIGIEFSLRGLVRIRRLVFVGGALQVLFTVGATAAGALLFGRPPNEALFWGWLISLSSTAIVLKVLQEKAEVDTPHGSTILGIMIFQDIVAVPMVLFTPLLAGTSGGGGWTMLLLAGKGVAVVLVALAAAKWIVPRLMFEVTRTRSRETFLLAVVVICLATAWGTSAAGLSIALGAFLAGLVVSESEYNHQALGSILPFKDVFTSFFFISIGMLLDLSFCARHPAGTMLLLLAVIVVKTVFGAAATLTLRLPLRTALLTGVGVAQVGEFAFVLSRIGVDLRLLSPEGNQVFLAASVLSMAATPPLLAFALKVSGRAGRAVAPAAAAAAVPGHGGEGGHLLIVGYGVNGRNVARAARLAGIAYEIVEMNAETVKHERARGEPISYGDATHEAVLAHVRAASARVAVVAINDAAATRRIVECLRRVNPHLRLIVRTRFTAEIGPLRKLGADEVIPEEFETSVEIFTRVLARFLVPRHEIERLVAVVRAEGYEMLRGLSPATAPAQGLGLDLPDVEVCALRVTAGSPIVGRSLEEAALRRDHGVTILAVRRGGTTDSNPAGSTVLQAADLLVVLGAPERVRAFAPLLSTAESAGKEA